LSYPLTVFCSKNVEKEKRRYRKLLKKLFEGLKENLKTLRSIIEDVIKLGKEAYGMKRLHCYSFESVKKWCSASVILTGMTFEFGFREKKVIQKSHVRSTARRHEVMCVSEWWNGENPTRERTVCDGHRENFQIIIMFKHF